MDAFKTIAHASEEEFVINRSRFIGRCFPIKTARAGKRPVFRMTASLPARRACP